MTKQPLDSATQSAIDHVLDEAKGSDLHYVDLQFTDVTGLVKTVTIPARQLEEALRHGVWFDGSAVEGFARVAESDMYLRPDVNTFEILPWESDKVARLICNVYKPGGSPFPGDPRAALQKAVSRAEALGFRYQVAPELEFYLFRQPLDMQQPQADDQASYFDLPNGAARTVRRAIVSALNEVGVAVEAGHHEVGPGQYEIDLVPLDALAMADAVMTARLAVKSVAEAHGLFATFMPKPLANMAGSGMHVHQQMRDLHDHTDRFGDPDADHGLSTIGRAFLAGQLTHARAMCGVLSPLVNSYKRLIAGLEAPTYITWAQMNRSALVRVPRARADQPEPIRLELRSIDPSCNPYLAFTVMLCAGLDGIENDLVLSPPAEEDIHTFNARRGVVQTLPTSLGEAVEIVAQSELIADALGQYLLERFVDAKQIEWNEYALYVSQWERDRYLRTY